MKFLSLALLAVSSLTNAYNFESEVNAKRLAKRAVSGGGVSYLTITEENTTETLIFSWDPVTTDPTTTTTIPKYTTADETTPTITDTYTIVTISPPATATQSFPKYTIVNETTPTITDTYTIVTISPPATTTQTTPSVTTAQTTPIVTTDDGTTTSGDTSYQLLIYSGSTTRTMTLTYINGELYVPATGLYKRADSTSFSTIVLIPTPTAWVFADGESIGVMNFPELLPNGSTATVPLTLSNPVFYPWLTNSNIPAPTDNYLTVTTTATGLLPTTFTAIVTTTNAEGATVTEVVVSVIEGNTFSTTTTLGTQATTISSVYTDASGDLTTGIIVVEVPTDGTRFVSGTATTKYTSTNICTSTDAAGSTVIITDIVVYCPESGLPKTEVIKAEGTTVIDFLTKIVTTSCISYTGDNGEVTSYTTTVTDIVAIPQTIAGTSTYTYPSAPAGPSQSAGKPSGPTEIEYPGAANSLGLSVSAAVMAVFAFALF